MSDKRAWGKMLLRSAAVVAFVAVVVIGTLGYVVFYGTPDKVDTMSTRQFASFMMDDPETLTSLGFLDGGILDFHSDELSDRSSTARVAKKDQARQFRKELDRYDRSDLSPDQALSWDVWTWWLDAEIAASQAEYAGVLTSPYVVNQLEGVQAGTISLLSSAHRLHNLKMVDHYIHRLKAFPLAVDQTLEAFQTQRDADVLPPRVVLQAVADQLDELLAPAPTAHPLVVSMTQRLGENSSFSTEQIGEYRQAAEHAVQTAVLPALNRLFQAVADAIPNARVEQPGVLALPGGDAFYEAKIRQQTTTNVAPEALYQLGLEEVQRLQAAIEAELQAQGYTEGTVAERIMAIRENSYFQVPNDDNGRKMMIEAIDHMVDEAEIASQDYFARIPEFEVEVRPIPEYARNTANNSYSLPSADGSRPGYFNLHMHEPAQMSRMWLPTLVYHETVPGHHFQSARNVESDLPILRRYLPFAAFSEGWGLYAETLAVEMGLYDDDPLGRIGALWSELYRAVRLVVDTGLHHAGWSHAEAVTYMAKTLGVEDSSASIGREVNRYLVLPGQALAYKVGHLKILQLRDRAEQELGDQFDIKQFHERVLEAGSIPLEILERRIDEWISEVARDQ